MLRHRLGGAARHRLIVVIAAAVALGFAAAVFYGIDQYKRGQVTEELLQPQAVMLLPAGNDPRVVRIGVRWTEEGWCVGQFQARATETPIEVSVGTVVSRLYNNQACFGVGTLNDMAWAELTLKAPFGTRLAVRASDGVVLPVLAANARLLLTGDTNSQTLVDGSASYCSVFKDRSGSEALAFGLVSKSGINWSVEITNYHRAGSYSGLTPNQESLMGVMVQVSSDDGKGNRPRLAVGSSGVVIVGRADAPTISGTLDVALKPLGTGKRFTHIAGTWSCDPSRSVPSPQTTQMP